LSCRIFVFYFVLYTIQLLNICSVHAGGKHIHMHNVAAVFMVMTVSEVNVSEPLLLGKMEKRENVFACDMIRFMLLLTLESRIFCERF